MILLQRTFYGLLVFTSVFSCRDNSKQQLSPIPSIIQSDSLSMDINTTDFANDTLFPGEKESMTYGINSIRNNFKRINAINQWTAISQKELSESVEGGVAKFYYQEKKLEKIVARHYGETYQEISEYYLQDGQLSFVLEKTYRYNRPMYYDSAAMKANNDTEIFNFDKSTIMEDRFYFEQGKLIELSPGKKREQTKNRAEEGKRIRIDFDKLMALQ